MKKNRQMNSKQTLHYRSLRETEMCMIILTMTCALACIILNNLLAVLIFAALMVWCCGEFRKVNKTRRCWDKYYGIKSVDTLLKEMIPEDDEQ